MAVRWSYLPTYQQHCRPAQLYSRPSGKARWMCAPPSNAPTTGRGGGPLPCHGIVMAAPRPHGTVASSPRRAAPSNSAESTAASRSSCTSSRRISSASTSRRADCASRPRRPCRRCPLRCARRCSPPCSAPRGTCSGMKGVCTYRGIPSRRGPPPPLRHPPPPPPPPPPLARPCGLRCPTKKCSPMTRGVAWRTRCGARARRRWRRSPRRPEPA